MESERDKYIRRLMELVEARRQPGFGIVISLGDEKEKRERRRQRRLARVARTHDDPSGENE